MLAVQVFDDPRRRVAISVLPQSGYHIIPMNCWPKAISK